MFDKKKLFLLCGLVERRDIMDKEEDEYGFQRVLQIEEDEKRDSDY